MPYNCTKILVRSQYVLMSYSNFCLCKKERERKTRKSTHSYLVNSFYDFLMQLVSPSRQAPPQQVWWYQSDKRSQSYECVKIATFLFLLISALMQFVGTPFSLAAPHTMCLESIYYIKCLLKYLKTHYYNLCAFCACSYW